MSKTESIIKNIIIILLIVMLFLAIYPIWHIRFSSILKVKEYEPTRLVVTPTTQTLDKKTAKKLISDLYKTPHIYIEKDIKGEYDGKAIPQFRVVVVDEGISLHAYIIAYTHELTHVKYQVGNETFTAYKTFITLYESGNAELKYHAMVYANDVLSGSYGRGEYDCGYYILKYLKQGGAYVGY